MRLTKKDIDRANKRRKYSDGRGLFLSVSKSGSKTWPFCYRFPDPSKDTTGPDGKFKRGYRERELSLGSIDFMAVDEARDRTVELRRLVRQGIDPMEERDREMRHVVRQKRDGSTFKQIAERYIDMKKAEWDKGGASEQSWRGSPVTSRSNCANESSTLRVSRPIEEVVLNASVTETKLTLRASKVSTIRAKSARLRVSRSIL